MPDETTQPTILLEPTPVLAEPQSAPVIAPTATQSPTEPTTSELANLEKPLEAPPEAPEGPTSPSTTVLGQTLESPISVPEPQNPSPAPVQTAVEPPPTPVPAPQPTVVIQAPNPRSFLAKALEKIQFRKRAKLEKIVRLATEKKSIANDQVQKLLYVSDATASRYLLQLVRDGRLRKVGPDGRARYEPVSGSIPTK